jgi:Protein of unknown function (DUF3102)
MSPAPEANAPDLDAIAEKIKADHSAIVAAMTGKGLVLKAIEIGKQLKQAKASVDHGEWETWLKEKCKLKERTAQRYMRLVDKRDKIESHLAELRANDKTVTLSVLSLSEAYELTADPNKQRRKSTQQPPSPLPASTQASDNVDDLVDALIAKLKAMRSEKKEEAEAAALDLVEKLKLIDLLEEEQAPSKKAA